VLQPGEDAEAALLRHAGQGVLLILESDQYSSSDWCLREVEAARAAHVPTVALGAFLEGEERSSPVTGNIRRLPLQQGWTWPAAG
jgi:hypothetical protein